MIGRKHSDDIRALQESGAGHAARLDATTSQIEALIAQIATLASHVATLSAGLTAELERSTEAAAKVSGLELRLAEAERLAAMQEAALFAQVGETDRLRDQAGRQAETIRQLQGALARIERQAAIDMDEVRQTSAAFAQTVLRRRAEHAASPADPIDA